MINVIKWDESFSVNVPILDKQHKELINLLNLMKIAIMKRKDKTAQGYIIQKMMEYTLFHFSTEEDLLREKKFKDLEKHIDEHSEYIKKADKIYKDFLENKSNISIEILTFLNNWWKSHILQSDQKYSDFLKE